MGSIFIVAWLGGAEPPIYAVKREEQEAMDLAEVWSCEMVEGEQIDVLNIDLQILSVERIKADGSRESASESFWDNDLIQRLIEG